MQVPHDAWSMDMVFSDSGDLHGGFYDNNAGVDYHIPIANPSVTRPPLRIAHVSVEMAPIAKACTYRDGTKTRTRCSCSETGQTR